VEAIARAIFEEVVKEIKEPANENKKTPETW
jgi:hypothetical protein